MKRSTWPTWSLTFELADELYQFPCFSHSVCQGFFDKNVFAFSDRLFAKGKMSGGGSDNIYYVTGVD